MGYSMGYKCAGCGRHNIHIENFPDDYPRVMMLCCACILSYYRYLGISYSPLLLNGYYLEDDFSESWWDFFGEEIEEAMRIL